nr:hypothetical protein GCM10020093_056520 [Planobispora longispora]
MADDGPGGPRDPQHHLRPGVEPDREQRARLRSDQGLHRDGEGGDGLLRRSGGTARAEPPARAEQPAGAADLVGDEREGVEQVGLAAGRGAGQREERRHVELEVQE